MNRMDRFVTVVAVSMATLLFAGASTAVHAAEAAHHSVTPPPAAPRLFDTLDADQDQVLSRPEFQSGYAGLQRLIAMQFRLREQFDTLDVNRSGAIDANEYAALELIKRQGKAAPPLSAFDADRDQKLDFVEYATLVRRLATGQAPAEK